jgi:hypothetical protein
MLLHFLFLSFFPPKYPTGKSGLIFGDASGLYRIFIYCLFNDTVKGSDYKHAVLNDMLVWENNELAKTWKDAAVAWYELPPRLAERAEKNHEPESRWPVCDPKFEVYIHGSNATYGASEGRRSAFARCPKILRPSTVTNVMKYVEGQAIQTTVFVCGVKTPRF